MKKLWWGVLLLIILLVLVFRQQIYTYLTTPTYWELTDIELVRLNEKRKQAYDYAVTCSGTENPTISFEEIEWILVPGHVLKIKATDGTARLKGWFDPDNNTIFMPFTERNTHWIMAHEAMHAIGYIGHPYHPFYTCALTADQNTS
jgi:hypothetical protein